jgi:dihydrofolate synthase / folylpolyglutamate synthase
MLKTYEEAIAWMDKHLSKKVKPGLERVQFLLHELGNPEKKLKAIHISGTNGKGSTLQFINSIFIEHQLQVGTFTSPFLYKWNESICINNEEIKDEDLIYHLQRIIPIVQKMSDNPPSEFEVMTVLAFDYFAHKSLDYVLIETGLGGRLDSTNVITPILTIITNVGMDHMSFLGNSIVDIAIEKAGIMKEGVPLVTGVERKEALDILMAHAKTLKVKMSIINRDFNIQENTSDTFTFSSQEKIIRNLSIPLKGVHQLKNVQLALQAFLIIAKKDHIPMDKRKIQEGLKKTSWPGRYEKISQHPIVIIDGAHNVDGMSMLIHSLQNDYPSLKKHLIISMMKDKQLKEVINLADEAFDSIYFTSFEMERAADEKDLFELSNHPKKQKVPSFELAYQQLLKIMDIEKEIIVFSGSLYLISRIRKFFLTKVL